MNIVVVLKMVPDVVEELEVGPDGRSLDLEFLRLIISESDDRALDQGFSLGKRYGGKVTIVAPDAPEVDDVLFTALAAGADRVVKVVGDLPSTTSGIAATLAAAIPTIPDLGVPDVVLSGCQAIDDLDGFVAPLLADALGLPYIGLVGRIEISSGVATVEREYAGSVSGEFEIDLPAVIGIQRSESPPRYIPVARVRAAKAEGAIEEIASPEIVDGAGLPVSVMAPPEAGESAEMITGSPRDAAAALAEILAGRGLL